MMREKRTRRLSYNLKKHRDRVFKTKGLPIMKKSNLKKRRILAPMENLDNLSVNTRRFLNRSFMQKLNEDEKIKRMTKPFRRRSLGNGSINSDSASNAGSKSNGDTSIVTEDISNEKELPYLDEITMKDGDVCCESNDRSDPVKETDVDTDSQIENEIESNPSKTEIRNEDERKSEEREKPKAEGIINKNDLIEADKDLDVMQKEESSDEASADYEFRSIKCKFCRGTTDSVVKYLGPPPDSRTETEILNLNELKVCEEEEDDTPQYKITEFSVFDKAGHLCAFDGNLVQHGVELFFSGFVKPIYEDNPDIEGGYPCAEMGPMTQWWIAGFDEGEKVIIGFTTDLGDYYLLRPTAEYAPFMETVTEKILVTKIVIEFLQSKSAEGEIAYDDLLKHLETRENLGNLAPLNEEKLIEFADFIYDQVLSYESTAEEDEPRLMVDSDCMKKLAELGGIELTEKIHAPIKRRRAIWGIRKDSKLVRATTTSLVQNVFDSLFNNQMNESSSENMMFRPCVVKLTRLENLHRYLGSWKMKSNPSNRKENYNDVISQLEIDSLKKNLIKPCTVQLKPLAGDELEKYLELRRELKQNGRDFNTVLNAKFPKNKRKLSDDDNEIEYKPKKVRKFVVGNVTWQSEPELIDDTVHYTSAQVGNVTVRVGDFVSMLYNTEIGLIKYMWEDDKKKKLCHLQWFLPSSETILGDAGHKQEIFLTEECEDLSMAEIDKVVKVDRLPFTNWREIGNFVVPSWQSQNSNLSNTFFYQKRYEDKFGRFRDLPESEEIPNACSNCGRKREMENREIPLPIGRMEFNESSREYNIKTVRWRDQNFSAGTCVFLSPNTLMENKQLVSEPKPEEVFDEVLYPEKYRKKFTRDDDDNTIENPFDIAFISEIFSKKRNVRRAQDIRLRVKKFYRPHNTHLKQSEADLLHLNLLYWSEEECHVKFDKVMGKCFVSYEQNADKTIEDWSTRGPYRFYFSEAYDQKTKSFTKPSRSAVNIGNLESDKTDANVPFDWPEIPRPLRTMDVFAGCGGLSEGLHQSGVAECLWAIEKFEAPANAFRLNNKNAEVYVSDCNDLLSRIIEGDDPQLPKRGDVELLCGGPPCQGFSRMNRFKDGDYSKFKNSLITTYLSYCDHFRPRFFILENVRDFVTSEKNMVFKLTLSCLVRMGYQVGFSVMQCGKYGIPQSRRRTIILAAAPGETLPNFPEPTHAFPLHTFLDVSIGGKKYVSDMQWSTSAPYRTITVADAISDLPKIKNNDQREHMLHKSKPLTHFQQMARGANSGVADQLPDHMCKTLAPLILKRISYIPCGANADWRDLPNIEVQLADGKRTKKLKYTHYDLRNSKSQTKRLMRGVCPCASNYKKDKCNPKYKQGNTLIPWCLPHTANRHNQWSGLYGRLGWNSYFRTVVTNPEPMGKQGRVLHPEQNRVVSVREYARSQGFPDSFKFYGGTAEKYAQVGNAVAPPLAKAIGFEIRKSVAARKERL